MSESGSVDRSAGRPIISRLSSLTNIWRSISGWFTAPINLSSVVLFITKLGVVLILLPVVAFLIWDQALIWWSGPSVQRLEEREFLCTQFALPKDVPEPNAALSPELLEVQRAMIHVSLMKEKARSYIQPTGTIDRVTSYLKCANVTDVSTSSLSIKHTLRPDFFQHLDLHSRVELELSEYDQIAGDSGIFAEQIPDRIKSFWIDSLRQAEIALGTRQQKIAKEQREQPTALPPGTKKDIVAVSSAAWVLIVGGDKSLESAVSQVRITREIVKKKELQGQENVTLMSVSGWYRTVIPFETRTAAQNALNTLISDLPYGGYSRNIPHWCGGQTSKDITADQSNADKDTLSDKDVKLWSCS